MSGIAKQRSAASDPVPVDLGAPVAGDEIVDLSGTAAWTRRSTCIRTSTTRSGRPCAGRQAARAAAEPARLGETCWSKACSNPPVGGRSAAHRRGRSCGESPRSPCFKFNTGWGFSRASKMMIQSGYTGAYCAVVRQQDRRRRQNRCTSGDRRHH
jgi:hypothetical protein